MNGRLNDPRTGGLLALTMAVAVAPWLLPNSFYFDVATHAMLNAMVCVGLNLLIGYAGQISLGHAGFIGIGAYATAVLAGQEFGWHPVLAMASGGAIAVGLAFLLARPILRLKGHYLAMATLGMGIIISIVINTEDQYTGGPDGIIVDPLTVFGLTVEGEWMWYWLVGVSLVVAVWLALNLIESPIGRALRAIHTSETAAEVAGINTAFYKALIFVMSALLASIAGSLGAHYAGFITPADVGFFKSIELVTMVVLGGMASIYGSVVGAVILTVLPQLLTELQDYEHMVFGGILMLTMIFMPRGLVPTIITFLSGRREDRGQ